eukprot:Sspe_Gene.43964::Locus_21508_Transcript_1_1_Confidence_1.000_Length_1058::g.43964::m.43964
MSEDNLPALRAIPPVRLYFLRHAQSENNACGASDDRIKIGSPLRALRQPDPGITARGVRQAEAAGTHLAALASNPDVPPHHKPGLVISSLMKRTLETTSIVAGALRDAEQEVDVVGWPEAHEEGGVFGGSREKPDDGIFHGCTAGEIAKLCSDMQDLNIEWHGEKEKGWYRGGCESAEDIEPRAQRVVELLWAEVAKEVERRAAGHEPRALLLINHGLFMDRLRRILMTGGSLGPGLGLSFLSRNCALDAFDLRIGTK